MWQLRLWKIKHESTAWLLRVQEDDNFEVPDLDDIKGASHEAFSMNQRIVSETFRFKFLNYNRSWLIGQLPSILTPRTMRRSRPYLINQFQRILSALQTDISDDSDAEGEDFGPVALGPTARTIIRYGPITHYGGGKRGLDTKGNRAGVCGRVLTVWMHCVCCVWYGRWWLTQARRRLRLKEIVQPLINKGRGVYCEQCLSRKQLQVRGGKVKRPKIIMMRL